MDQPWTIVLAVVIPIVAFMVALRPFIKDTAQVCSSELEQRLHQKASEVDARLGRIEERLVKLETLWATFQLVLPDALKMLGTKGNPISPETRNLYLDKLKAGTITPQESAELTEELQAELKAAQDSKDAAVIVLIIMGLALLASIGKK